MAGGAMLSNSHIDQSTAHMLLTDPSGQNVNGQNGAVGLFLDLSVATFQPVLGYLSGSLINAGPDGWSCFSVHLDQDR